MSHPESLPAGYRPPRALFNTGLDEVATRWFKNQNAPQTDLPQIREKAGLEAIKVGEGLIVSPAISFKVYGENVVLCMLIHAYGVKAVEQLLEEKALQFVLWSGEIFKLIDPPKGVHPLMGGAFNTAAHIDPQASIELGLKGWCQTPSSELRRLSRLATERTTIVPKELPDAVVRAIYDSYNNNALADFDASYPLGDMPPSQVEKLHQLAASAMRGAILLKNEYDFHEAPETWNALLQIGNDLFKKQNSLRAVERILAMERLPSIRQLMLAQIIKPSDVLRIRNSEATREFRKWLWSQPNPSDAEAVSRQYLSEITQKKTIEKTWFKTTKMLSMQLVGTAINGLIGLKLAGTPGLIAGATAGLALASFETFGFDKLLNGANPRRFADEEIRPRLMEQANPIP